MTTALGVASAFLTGLRVEDPLGHYWLVQATTRLRREICWIWHERGQADQSLSGRVPPPGNRLDEALDHSRSAEQKRLFFERDETAAYLTGILRLAPPETGRLTRRGSFSWVAHELELSELDCFALALSLLPALDCTSEAVIAACANDGARVAPSLALLQRLWDEPSAVLSLTDSTHKLYRLGLLHIGSGLSIWDMPLSCPPAVLSPLLNLEKMLGSEALRELEAPAELLTEESFNFTAAQLAATPPRGLRILPLRGAPGAPFERWAAELGRQLRCGTVELRARPPRSVQIDQWLSPWITRAWLDGKLLYLAPDFLDGLMFEGSSQHIPLGNRGVPATIVLATTEQSAIRRFGIKPVPALDIPPCSYHERMRLWITGLNIGPDDHELLNAAADCARRFRLEGETVARISGELRRMGRRLTSTDLATACRHDLDLGELAQRVEPRFELLELVLPPRQYAKILELIEAMKNLTRVHYEWGTGRAWGESGLSALFSGPPGTGKTMAAEVVSRALNLPLYRIDLSQVVNKYIGETEKNLRRLFDAADASDVVLFFDEADSLFGRRTEVRDAHDRYANLEVSYLLGRMERFKGLAILATNRKKDLDDAFTRRLRFIIDFPLPAAEEREHIWRGAMPADVDCSEIDFPFLGRQFPFAGGHIRSVVFHACLQAAKSGSPRRLTMAAVIAGVKYEYEKAGRAMSLETFGPWSGCVVERGV